MKRSGGPIRKVEKTYPLFYKRGAWSVDILECGHAVLNNPPATQEKKPSRRCGLCMMEGQRKKVAKAIPRGTPLQQLKALMKSMGSDGVLELLAKHDSHNKARRAALAKAREARMRSKPRLVATP